MRRKQKETSMKPSSVNTSSKLFLEEISRYCYSQLTLCRFNKASLTIDEKYREGRITALNYISDLAFYFIQEEKQLKEHFLEALKKQVKRFHPSKHPPTGRVFLIQSRGFRKRSTGWANVFAYRY